VQATARPGAARGAGPAKARWPHGRRRRPEKVADRGPGGWYTRRAPPPNGPRGAELSAGRPGAGCRRPGGGPGAAPLSDVTRVLAAIERGDPRAAEQLLPLVYDQLRQLAAQKLAHETPGQTLQATALVHEAYLRLVEGEEGRRWDSRGHFFAAAAEAM